VRNHRAGLNCAASCRARERRAESGYITGSQEDFVGAHCCHHDNHEQLPDPQAEARQRRVLWTALVINAAMFVVEVGAGLAAGSVSLQADALDFLADAGNYAVSLAVVGMVLRRRATAALLNVDTLASRGAWRRHGARYSLVVMSWTPSTQN
jgi:hypothetical protein